MSKTEGGSENETAFAISVARLPQDGSPIRFEAGAEQRAAIARRFGLVDVERFEADLFAARWQKDGVSVDGKLTATVVQTDVVTLEPVRQPIAEDVRLLFVPEHSRLASALVATGDEVDLDPGDDVPETFRGDRIDLVEPLFQIFGLGLDPYPRAPDAEFRDVVADEAEPSPFAVLARLREGKG